ncbi:MAG: hypothetical protein HETSPECPRED_009072, partial [Heterodermia speciosa]
MSGLGDMATSSPPTSPPNAPQRPLSAIYGMQRSSSRLSISSKQGSSRFSDEDAKTSVKVAVRVRPPLRPSDPGFELVPQRFQRSLLQAISPTSLAIDIPQGRKLFHFDRVFEEDVSQEGIWEYVNESVEAFIQGYNVSVLAYGQSGSGKSYTMGTSGPAEQSDPRIMGVIPRAVDALFQKLQGPPAFKRSDSSNLRAPTRYSMTSPHSSSQNVMTMAKLASERSWQMKATYVEIYNEQLRDLLLPESVPHNERATVAIREDTKGRILLTGLHQVSINSAEDLLSALNFGSSIRQTDATAINAKSSRSHAVFSINLVQRKTSQPSKQEKRMSVPLEVMSGSESWVTVDSKLHFVDLAGSERLKNTQAYGDRAKEGIAINAGLANLGKVISQLSSRQPGSHVSYRDSKLTRLLQDSLGGNAITYMIACVTPAEFHLSETLNTLQYAYRARAIQSKPEIQQLSDDSDKQAVIDRLRAEILFLRDQINSSDRGDRRGDASTERLDRQNDREMELQNHLLDVQENYTALTQRHAKLISEITKARDDRSHATPILTEAIGNAAIERLNRSNSFAEAVEQVVLEYEKTITSLESSLSKTRSSLSETESSLLERESKCAYVETVNQQLQSRFQKMMDREASTERYLHDLEARLDGQVSGEEKTSAVVTELRKEIARIRESEASCEEYISTLEERLAESDQDMELMQREVDRLEHVVERQRSIGKLDSLLYEFDHIQSNGRSKDHSHGDAYLTNGPSNSVTNHDDQQSILEAAVGTAIPESDSEDPNDGTAINSRKRGLSDLDESFKEDEEPEVNGVVPGHDPVERPRSNPVNSKLVADSKLEGVTHELFELRAQHESTLTEFDLMSAKYEEALRTLAELQDAADEARHPAPQPMPASPASTRPVSFLGDARVSELKNAGQPPSSRSLSSELSLAAESNTSLEQSPDGSPIKKSPPFGILSRTVPAEHHLQQEIQYLRRVQEEKDDAIAALKGSLKDRDAESQHLHAQTLEVVEELKAEIQRLKIRNPNSPTKVAVRRKGSQNILMLDRAHRSLASLRNIASENLEAKPETMQAFDHNLNTTMQELHERAERVQVLEGELAKAKKEIDAKTTMISGLTRERSSLKSSSPIDISVVSSIHEQLIQNEGQVKVLQESHAAREQELLSEIDSLKKSLDVKIQTSKKAMPGFFPETPAILDNSQSSAKQLGEPATSPDVSGLQEQVAEWQGKHQAVLASMQASEQKFLDTISELETSMATIGASQSRDHKEQAAAEFENERSRHAETVESLQQELRKHNALVDSHQEKINELERSHVSAREQLEENARYKALAEAQLSGHQSQVASLERKVMEHQSDIEFHKHGLKSLHDSHTKELETIQTRLRSQLAEEADGRIANMTRDHENQLGEQKSGFDESMRTTNVQLIESIEARDKISKDLHALETEHNSLSDRLMHLEEETRNRGKELDDANHRNSELKSALTEATAAFEDYKKLADKKSAELDKVVSEKEKAVRLVDELEDQLSTTYDQHRATSSRLSVLSSGRDQALLEANSMRTKLEEEVELYRSKLSTAELERSNSQDSHMRKSTSAMPLPSPPPAIPLPPIPTMASASNISLPNGITSPQPDFSYAAPPADETERHIKSIEKHLFAEKQLTATLEEALVDLESQGNKTKMEMEGWKKKAWAYEDELVQLKRERGRMRDSVQAVEEEREARKEAERARERLEERMRGMEGKRRKK